MTGAQNILQTGFMDALAARQSAVTLHLRSGVGLQGRIVAHDRFTLLLERSGQSQLVFKSAIATIVPRDEIDLAG